MTIFIDTGIFLALYDIDDRYHERSRQLIKNALKGNFGRLFTSDYILDEAITATFVRTRKHAIAVELGKYVIESPRISKLVIDKETFDTSWKKFQTLNDKGLSFTDCTSIALSEKHGIKQLMSFDSGFDGLIQRIC